MNNFSKEVKDGIKYSLYHYDLLMNFSSCDGEYIQLHKVWIDDEFGNDLDVVWRIQEACWNNKKLEIYNTFYKSWVEAQVAYCEKIYDEIITW